MKKILLLSSILLVFTACDELIEEISDALSSFNVTVTGNVTSSFSGEATFVQIINSAQTPASSNIVIDLKNPDDDEESVILWINSLSADGLLPGTYIYDENETEYSITTAYNTATTGYIYPVDGKITQIILSRVEDTRVQGSFTLNVADPLGEEVEVKGTFNAVGVTNIN